MTTYQDRRTQLATYFDRTAVEAWSRLTTDAPVGRIRATVREGRARMRATLLGWLPENLEGRRILDAGCGTGMLSAELAARGAEVVAVDLSPTLVALAQERAGDSRIDYRVGDMLDPALGRFDHIVAMDSLIHYRAGDMVALISGFAEQARASILVTFAPRTPLLSMMHASGKLFPRANRSPAIEPVREATLRKRVAADPALTLWRTGRTQRIGHGFYTSQALEVLPR